MTRADPVSFTPRSIVARSYADPVTVEDILQLACSNLDSGQIGALAASLVVEIGQPADRNSAAVFNRRLTADDVGAIQMIIQVAVAWLRLAPVEYVTPVIAVLDKTIAPLRERMHH